MASKEVGGHEAMASQRWWRVRCRGTVVVYSISRAWSGADTGLARDGE